MKQYLASPILPAWDGDGTGEPARAPALTKTAPGAYLRGILVTGPEMIQNNHTPQVQPRLERTEQQLTMLETDEIIAAAQARTPLIKQGDTLSKDAYFYMGTHVKMVCRKALLLHTSTKCADSLIPFSGFYVKYKCDMCHAETVKIVSKVKMMKIHGSYDCWWNLHCSIREREGLPHISYLQLI